MSAWTKDELKRITVADDLHISPFREDGATYGTPTWIWSVVVGHELYVRPYNGSSSRWYKAAMTQKAGRIAVAGITREVGFEPAVDQRPNRRCLSSEVQEQSISPTDDRLTCPRNNHKDHAAPDLDVEEHPCPANGSLDAF
jgi:hypothetical protein